MQKIIGVFDSGVGGKTTLTEIQKVLPDAKTVYFGDSKNCPYGEKSQNELIKITSEIVERFTRAGATMVVIACNTATTQCIKTLREKFPGLTFVGTEPALKIACDRGYQNILLMATPVTIRSQQVARLVEKNVINQGLTLLPCAGLAELVEAAAPVEAKLEELLSPIPNRDKIDAVVLGCTHYVYLKPQIQSYFPNAELIDGNSGVAKRVASLL